MPEVSVWLQKSLHSLALMGDVEMREAAEYHQHLALKRAQIALNVEEDFTVVRNAGKFTESATSLNAQRAATSDH